MELINKVIKVGAIMHYKNIATYNNMYVVCNDITTILYYFKTKLIDIRTYVAHKLRYLNNFTCKNTLKDKTVNAK